MGNSSFSLNLNDTDSHLENFSKHSSHDHESIDETSEKHSHRHKHTEDGEEHEHQHKHSTNLHSDFKLLSFDSEYLNRNNEIKLSKFFIKNDFIPSPHPNRIFRPPILAV